MREIKMNVLETEGYAVTVEILGSVEEYAMNFLHIFNNVRENKELLKVKNYYGSNDVTVYCTPEAKDELIRYLGSFGEFKDCEKVLLYQMTEPEYDINKYDDAIVIPDFD